MWKLLPVLFLVACASIEPKPSASGDEQSTQGRIVRQIALPVESSTQTVDNQLAKKAFQRTGLSGWLDDTGAWHIRAEVQHGRLLCGTYQVGIQLGSGNPACANVVWLSEVAYATRHLHCNSATLPHSGGGEFSNSANRIEEVTCVRVVIRCEGAC